MNTHSESVAGGLLDASAARLLAPGELAQRLNVSTATLYLWRSRDRGPAWTKVGGQVRYAEAAVNDWLTRNTFTTETAL